MEGPSLLALYHRIKRINGKTCTIESEGIKLKGQVDLVPYGKRLIIREGSRYIRVFFGMSGTAVTIKRRKGKPSLTLTAEDGIMLYFYGCSLRVLSAEEFQIYYKPETDIMDIHWDPLLAREKILAHPSEYIADILLNQDIFCGSGNIIKNEVLWRTMVHPLKKIEDIPSEKINEIIGEIITFSYLFYKARVNGSGIRSILNVYRRRTCPTCGSYVKKENLGLGTRVTFWCPDCQD
jgi:endonuclease-8